jgi:hypothetical protein
VGIVFERTAKKRDGTGKGTFGHSRTAPHGIHQLILGDQVAVMVEKLNQQPIGLWFERERLSGTGHAPLSLVDLYVRKPQCTEVRASHLPSPAPKEKPKGT